MTFLRLYFGLRQRLVSFVLKFKKKEIGVLTFHEVCDAKKAIDPAHFTARETFVDLMNRIERNVISLKEIQEGSANSRGSGPKFIVAFDDVYQSAVENALPYLHERGIPFVLFVCKELVDRGGYVTSSQIRSLKDDPLCEVAFHSNHHVFTRKLNKAQFAEEIDCTDFNEQYGLECHYYAFPFGSCYASKTRGSKPIISKRYFCAFSTVFGFAKLKSFSKGDSFIPRIVFSELTKNQICKIILTKHQNEN